MPGEIPLPVKVVELDREVGVVESVLPEIDPVKTGGAASPAIWPVIVPCGGAMVYVLVPPLVVAVVDIHVPAEMPLPISACPGAKAPELMAASGTTSVVPVIVPEKFEEVGGTASITSDGVDQACVNV